MLYNCYNRLYNYAKIDCLKTVKTILFGMDKSQFKGHGPNSILILNEDRE